MPPMHRNKNAGMSSLPRRADPSTDDYHRSIYRRSILPQAIKANMDTIQYVWALVILITIPSITTISILSPYHYLEIALLVYYDQ